MSLEAFMTHAVSGLAAEAEFKGIVYEALLPDVLDRIVDGALVAVYAETGGHVDSDQKARLRATVQEWWWSLEADEQLAQRRANTP